MIDSQIPVKFAIIFASSAPAGDVTAPIPTTPQSGGLVSMPTGFTEVNFTPVAAGGVPPYGKDVNGLFQALTAWLQWYQAGGPITYDSTFQAALTPPGYPKGAIVQSATTAGSYWRSTVENNLTNPDTGGAGWIQHPFPIPLPIADGGSNSVGPFTMGSVLYFDGTRFAQDNANFYWNDSLERLGIGTNAPNDGLDVRSGGGIFNGNLVVAQSGTFGAGVTATGYTVNTGTLNGGLGIIAPNPTIGLTNTLTSGQSWVMQHENTADRFTWSYNAVGKAFLDTAGNLNIQGTLTQASDIALKENVLDLGPVLERLLRARPVRFNRYGSERSEIGLIAQEFRELFPEFVSAGTDGQLGIAYASSVSAVLRGLQELTDEVRRPGLLRRVWRMVW